jgi:fumigaclavine B O-acetyltransferase
MTKDSFFHGFELTPADYTFPMFYAAGAISFQLKAPETGISILQKGIERLIVHHPFLAGVVIPSEKRPGTFRVVPTSEQLRPTARICTVQQLRQQQIPSSKIASPARDNVAYDRNKFLALVPVQVAESSAVPPVIRFQINVLTNGLILGIFANHMVIDGTGIGTLMQSLAICCREFHISDPAVHLPSDSSYEVSSRAILAAICQNTRAKDIQDVNPDPIVTTNEHSANDDSIHDASLVDHDFYLSAAKIEQILHWTREQTPKTHGQAPVSADDVVTAVLWKCLSHFRGHLVDGSSKCALQRAVNARRHIQPPLSANYLGNCFIFLDHLKSTEELNPLKDEEAVTEEGFMRQIGSIACFLRANINAVDDQFVRDHFKKFVTAGTWSETSIHIPDVVVSSIRRLPIHEQNFGDVLGHVADFEILPYMVPEGVCTIKPRRDAESWEVSVTLTSPEMDLLRSDPMLGWLVDRDAPTCMFEAA